MIRIMSELISHNTKVLLRCHVSFADFVFIAKGATEVPFRAYLYS